MRGVCVFLGQTRSKFYIGLKLVTVLGVDYGVRFGGSRKDLMMLRDDRVER